MRRTILACCLLVLVFAMTVGCTEPASKEKPSTPASTSQPAPSTTAEK
ncbi:MAG: hypothetical protein JW809_10940 [Pirellulales bacterium]|nr:hypothetical protein [Pirellulales bacterium]